MSTGTMKTVTSHSPIAMDGGLLPSLRIRIIHTGSNPGLLLDLYLGGVQCLNE